jgi:predicted DNA-binding protein
MYGEIHIMKKEQNTSQLQIRIQPSLYERLKKVCEHKYKSISGTMKDLIVKFVEENEKL